MAEIQLVTKSEFDSTNAELINKTKSVVNVYIDSVSGNDNNDGMTTGTPIKTFNKATQVAANTANTEVVFLFKSGTTTTTSSWIPSMGKKFIKVTTYGDLSNRAKIIFANTTTGWLVADHGEVAHFVNIDITLENQPYALVRTSTPTVVFNECNLIINGTSSLIGGAGAGPSTFILEFNYDVHISGNGKLNEGQINVIIDTCRPGSDITGEIATKKYGAARVIQSQLFGINCATNQEMNALVEQNDILVTPAAGYTVENCSKKINRIIHLNLCVSKTDESDFAVNTNIGNIITAVGSIGAMLSYTIPLVTFCATAGGSYFPVDFASVNRSGAIYVGKISQTGIKKIYVAGTTVLQ